MEAFALDSKVQLTPKSHPAVSNNTILNTLNITNPEPERYVFDLGQNMVGVPEINIPAIQNQKITIRFAEMLNQDGTLYTDNYRSARSKDTYIPKETGDIVYRPKFTFHGFRYVELSGFDANELPKKSWVKGIVQHSEFKTAGGFKSSHKKLNQLQSNITWGLRGNLLDIPTDCPQRDERLGWTGDAQVITPTAMFNYDTHAFWASWLHSMREEQGDLGNIPIVIPNIFPEHEGIIWSDASSGWADAATVIPWELYFRTGDVSLLEDNYDMMKGLLEFYKSRANNHIVKMFTFGDWLQPYPETGRLEGDTQSEFINTAYYAHSIDLTIRAAKVLGKTEDANNLNILLNKVKNAFKAAFFDTNGKLTTTYETQTGYLMILGLIWLMKRWHKRYSLIYCEKLKMQTTIYGLGF